MPPRAFAVTTAIASATWLVLFSAGCAHAGDSPKPETAAAAGPQSPHLRYVTNRPRKASDFKRVSEYFTGKPENGDDLVLPSDPASRDGRWFTFAVGLTEFFTVRDAMHPPLRSMEEASRGVLPPTRIVR